MTKWIEYTGSDEQIYQINNAKHGYTHRKNRLGKSEYIMNNPHPYANEIKIWADTGLEVYWKSKTGGGSGICHEHFPPFAHPNEFEYRLTPFED